MILSLLEKDSCTKVVATSDSSHIEVLVGNAEVEVEMALTHSMSEQHETGELGRTVVYEQFCSLHACDKQHIILCNTMSVYM